MWNFPGVLKNRLTGLHTKSGSQSEKRQKKSEGEKTIWRSVVLLVGGSQNYHDEDGGSQEFGEEARGRSHVIEL